MRAVLKLSYLIVLLTVVSFQVSLNAQTIAEAREAFNAGVKANEEGNFTEAINQFNNCYDICEVLIENEEEGAQELLDNVQVALPSFYLSLASEQVKQSNLNQALENLHKAKELASYVDDNATIKKADRVIPQLHFKIGYSHFKIEEFDLCIKEMDKAIATNKNYAAAYYLKATAQKRNQDVEGFKATSLAGIKAAENSNDTKYKSKITDAALNYYLKKGVNQIEASKYDRALVNIETALEFNPNDATSLYYLLLAKYNMGKYDEALEVGNKALENETRGNEAKAKIYFTIAQVYTKKADKENACANYKKASFGQFKENAEYQMEHVLKCK